MQEKNEHNVKIIKEKWAQIKKRWMFDMHEGMELKERWKRQKICAHNHEITFFQLDKFYQKVKLHI